MILSSQVHVLLSLILVVAWLYCKLFGKILEVKLLTSFALNGLVFVQIRNLFHLNRVVLISILSWPRWTLSRLITNLHAFSLALARCPVDSLSLRLTQLKRWFIMPRAEWLREELMLTVVTLLLV